MSKVMCQYALDRVIAFVRGHGVELTPEVCQKALRLVDRALEESREGQVITVALGLIPEFFDLPSPATPTHRPPLTRGSIGYY